MGLIEALSYGVPALITRGANMYDEILESKAGWVSETTKEGIIDSFKKMIADRSHLNTISDNAIKLAKKYDWNSLALNFHESVSEIIK